MSDIYVIIAFVVYALVMLGIGIMSYKKSKSMNDYFIGGRQLGSWTTAISAQASDMSGWLLMGLPGAIFLNGLTESWIAIGLFIGTYLNWKLLAAKLRKMSYAAGDAITIPEYFQKRFFTQNPVIRFACAAIIFVFFLVYTASAFSSGAKLFNFIFGTDYTLSLTIGAIIIISYTFLGGFFAVCWTDMIQGLLMFGALVIVPVVCVFRTPDISAVQFLNTNGEVIGNYLNMFENADGSIAAIHCTADLETGNGNPADGRKVKGTIHWVSAAHAVDAEVRLYDKLFTEANMNAIPEGSDYKDYLNPESVVACTGCKLEESLKDAKPGDKFQFVRTGFFTPDSKNPGVYNRVVTLRDSFKPAK